MKSFAKSTNDSINYVINKIFSWGKKKENDETGKNIQSIEKENTSEVAKINFNNEVKFEKNSTKK